MNLTVRPATRVHGSLTVPGDKSISHRAAILGALAKGSTRITNFLRAADTFSTLQCLAHLGVPIELPDDRDGAVEVTGVGFQGLKPPGGKLDCGNSGTTMRLLLGTLAGRPWATTLLGDASLNKRPMDRVQVPLRAMGAQVSGQGDRCAPPLTMQGGALQGITYAMPVASAQVKSAILLAGLQAHGQTTVVEPAPTRDHTERMLQAFGVPLSKDGASVSLDAILQPVATDVFVPGDISSAAFFLAAAALRPGWQVTVRDVGINPTRTGALDVLVAMGALVSIDKRRESGGEPRAAITVRGGELKAVEISGAMIPRLIDELPVLTLVATQATGQTIIRDAQELRVKESDRIAVLSAELRKLGAQIEEKPDGMTITGPTKLVGATVTSPAGDHRIAMTLAIAGLIAEGEVVIENAQAISTSFPDFAALLEQIKE